MQRKPGPHHPHSQHADDNRPAAELVHLDVGLAHAEVKGAVHGLAAGVEFDAAGTAGFTATASGSFRGWSVRRTSTSSSFSRFAAGLMRICLKELPGLISVMVPTGRSRGK